jgi:nicotinamide-nucleotide amidase
MSEVNAEIIAVGSELLGPARTETNSLFVTLQLNRLGIVVRRKWVVGDREKDLREALERALDLSELVIISGGLGPTHDDITREVVAGFLRRELHREARILEQLEKRFARVGLKMSENNRRQAMVPEGAVVLDNSQGTAPGLMIKENSRLIFLLPGPPRELYPMMTNQVIPLIKANLPVQPQYFRQLSIASEAESQVDSVAGPIYREYPLIETTILASAGIVELHFWWRGQPQEEEALRQLSELARRVKERLGASVFAESQARLEEVLGQLLRARSFSLATAESCTGGLIGKLLTDLPGSSDYYRGGVVCYSNDLKVGLLGVREETLAEHGAVSQEVAWEMAAGIRTVTRSDVGLSVTGVAGPGGGTPEKPVGLVFAGLATPDKTLVKRLTFAGDRDIIRLRSARFALDWLRRELL